LELGAFRAGLQEKLKSFGVVAPHEQPTEKSSDSGGSIRSGRRPRRFFFVARGFHDDRDLVFQDCPSRV
ncbi:MAG TPA: hypothetical protein VEX18_10180, partial [Polyangiaceae bacterium]|nr:hypothetical protein [Polyangiaceae bacterium]